MTDTMNFTQLSEKLEEFLGSARKGKVRDSYELEGNETMLLVASDRISIFDFVLGADIPGKGCILNALNIFWRNHAPAEIRHQIYYQDILAFGFRIDDYLPKELRGIPELQKRATVVKKLSMIPVEIIFRDYMLGSIWKDYKAGAREFCGHILPEGLHEGVKLPETIFTPTTKAEMGHDENIDYQSVEKMYGEDIREETLKLFKSISGYCHSKGILLADTKFEVGYARLPNGSRELKFRFADEICTPDSSRYFDQIAWTEAQKNFKSPDPRDKQFVRNWGIGIGINKRNPINPIDISWVLEQEIPEAIVVETQQIYSSIFHDLTSMNLGIFQRVKMGIHN